MFNLTYFLTCFFIVLCSTSNAEVVEIFRLERTPLDGAFSLLNKNLETEAVLDCASFIHNMNIKVKDQPYLYYLDHSECMSDFEYLMELPESRRCLHYDESTYSLSDCD